jgi:hypothetical protein
VGRNCSTRLREKGPLLESISGLLTEGGIAVLAEAVPRRSPRLSEVCDTGAMPQELAVLLLEAERILYEESDLDLLAWDGEDLAEAARAEGFEGVDLRYHRMEEQRIIRAEHIRRWFSLDTPQGAERNLAGAVWEAAGETESAAGSGGAGEMVEALTNELIGRLADRSIRWHTEYALLRFSL